MTNKYEDFAESFSKYIFANDRFVQDAKTNNSLRRKYNYIQSFVFSEDEFSGTNFETEKQKEYVWDTTKNPISVNKYLYYIK